MSISQTEARKVAQLARIAVADEALPALAVELSHMLQFMAQLSEVDVTGVEPMTAVIPNHLRLRDDVVTDGDVREKVLANAPAREGSFFGVPKVIE